MDNIETFHDRLGLERAMLNSGLSYLAKFIRRDDDPLLQVLHQITLANETCKALYIIDPQQGTDKAMVYPMNSIAFLIMSDPKLMTPEEFRELVSPIKNSAQGTN